MYWFSLISTPMASRSKPYFRSHLTSKLYEHLLGISHQQRLILLYAQYFIALCFHTELVLCAQGKTANMQTHFAQQQCIQNNNSTLRVHSIWLRGDGEATHHTPQTNRNIHSSTYIMAPWRSSCRILRSPCSPSL